MTGLPRKYRWLEKEDGPRLLTAFLSIYGTKEFPGGRSNPVIMAWAKDVGLPEYTADSIPWCGLAMAKVSHDAGWGHLVPANPLWARSWSAFGVPSEQASLGDILVFTRNGGGHVGVYVGEDDTHFHVIGGNQSDAVTITRIAKDRILKDSRGAVIGIRRPKWRVSEPANRRPVRLTATGPVSTNEA